MDNAKALGHSSAFFQLTSFTNRGERLSCAPLFQADDTTDTAKGILPYPDQRPRLGSDAVYKGFSLLYDRHGVVTVVILAPKTTASQPTYPLNMLATQCLDRV